jgi:predicted anti-sigma-YlaC factor YlaD
MKPECEPYQIALSAMLDFELSREEMATTIQHLSQCEDCRKEFEKFRRLQDTIEAGITSLVPSEKIWVNLQKSLKPLQRPLILKFRQNFLKIIAIAAVIFVAFGVGYYSAKSKVKPFKVNIPTVFTGKSAQMDEAQFIDFTRDLLNSDPKYSMKMYIVLQTLYEDKMEGGFEPPNPEEKTFNTEENIHRSVSYQQ